MKLRKARLTLASMAILGASLMGLSGLPAAHAASAPSISATADSVQFGLINVTGSSFTPGGSVQIEVLDPPTGAVLQTLPSFASAASGQSTGGLLYRGVAFTGSCTVHQVTVEAVDEATGTTSNAVAVSFGSPIALAQTQFAAAQGTLSNLFANPPLFDSLSALSTYAAEVSAAELSLAQYQAAFNAAVATVTGTPACNWSAS
jgi:hypothetical protein